MTRQEIRDEAAAEERLRQSTPRTDFFGRPIAPTTGEVITRPPEPKTEPPPTPAEERRLDLAALDEAFELASKHASEPKVQSFFRECYAAFRAKYDLTATPKKEKQ